MTSHPEDFRIGHARRTLAESKAAEPTNAAQWWGRMEHVVESLLAVIDERAPGGAPAAQPGPVPHPTEALREVWALAYAGVPDTGNPGNDW